MCFTPLVSIATAATEFSVVGYLVKTLKAPKLFPIPLFIFFLGMYQFTEFMLCTTGNTIVWARIGFVAFTFLPCTLYHSLINISGKKVKRAAYIAPVLFSALALFHPNFIISAGCNLLHVSIHSLIFDQNKILMAVYFMYYIVMPGLGYRTFSRSLRERFRKENITTSMKLTILCMPLPIFFSVIYFLLMPGANIDPMHAWIATSILITMVAITIVTLGSVAAIKRTALFLWALQCIITSSSITIVILYVVFPHFAYNFASIFCQFSLLYTLAAVLLVKNAHLFSDAKVSNP